MSFMHPYILYAMVLEALKRLACEPEVKAWLDDVVSLDAERSGISLSSGGALLPLVAR